MGAVLIKKGVTFGVIAPGGYAILSALRAIAHHADFDITITSGTDGEHAPNSKHYDGNAYDIRTHGLTEAQQDYILNGLEMALGTEQFYVELEQPGTPNEHIHIQTKRGTRYTVEDLLAWRG